jgi:hypothetical protein
LAASDSPRSDASWTSTSNPTRLPASDPLTRARLPVASRRPSSSSTSKGSGAQRAQASGSVSTSSTSLGRAAVVVVAVHVLMAGTLPATASRVVGRRDDLRRPAGGLRVILEDDAAIVSQDDDAGPFRG